MPTLVVPDRSGAARRWGGARPSVLRDGAPGEVYDIAGGVDLKHLERSGAAIALAGENATDERLRAALEPIITSPDRRTHMAAQARVLGRPDAAAQLTTALLRAGLG